jgi:hypothetical protein
VRKDNYENVAGTPMNKRLQCGVKNRKKGRSRK